MKHKRRMSHMNTPILLPPKKPNPIKSLLTTIITLLQTIVGVVTAIIIALAAPILPILVAILIAAAVGAIVVMTPLIVLGVVALILIIVPPVMILAAILDRIFKYRGD